MAKEYRYIVECPTTRIEEFIVRGDRILTEAEVMAAAQQQAKARKISHQIYWDRSSYHPLSKRFWHLHDEGTNG